MIFGTNIPKATGHQTTVQFPTSPNICFCTIWGKQNQRNMHRNEQQTSTNWRLDRIKIWSRWSELMKYIVYLLTIVLPVIKRVTGDTFVFQWDSALAHRHAKRSNCWSAKPQILSLRVCGPPTALTSIWSITSSGDHATAGLSDDVQECGLTQEATGWNLDWSEAELTLLSMHGETVCVLVFVQRADISNIDCSSSTTGHLDKLSARVTEM